MKTYKNVSPVEQLGIDPGQTGEADIPKEQEDRMIARGAIEVVGDAAPASSEETPGKSDEELAAEKAAEEKAKADAEAKAKAEAEAQAGGKRR